MHGRLVSEAEAAGDRGMSAPYDVLIASSGIAVGVAGTALALYFYRRGEEKKEAAPNYHKELARFDVGKRSVPKTELEKTRSELKTFLIEKELASAALTRLYEAESRHEITREEREILASRYRAEVMSLNEKISKIDAFVEVGDLETLREQLLELVSQKIEAIERRIDRTRTAATPFFVGLAGASEPKSKESSVLNEAPKQEDEKIASFSSLKATDLPQPSPTQLEGPQIPVGESKTIQKKKPSGGDEVEQLQKELLDALDKLQKLDVES